MSKNKFELESKKPVAAKHNSKIPAKFAASFAKVAPAPAPAPVVEEEIPVQEEAVAPEEYPLNQD
jgi:hypothetical protein